MKNWELEKKIEEWVKAIMTIKAEIELKTVETENEDVKNALFHAAEGLVDAFDSLRMAYEKLVRE